MDTAAPLRLLIVDDNPAIHKDFTKIFAPPDESAAELEAMELELFGKDSIAISRAQRPRFELSGASQGQDALEMVQAALAAGQPYALAFVDMRMPPGWDGLQTIQALWQMDPQLQCVICTAYSDYSWEQMVERLGNTDNLLILKKPFDVAEVQQMAAALTRKWLLAQQAQLKLGDLEQMVSARTQELRHSHEQFSITFHAAPMPQALFRYSDGACLDANAAFCAMTRRSLDAWKTEPLRHLTETQLLTAAQGPHPVHAKEIDVGGESTGLKASVYTQAVQFGPDACILFMALDISERARLEDQLRHAQKMEAVGQLAAGIAHDFNNILTVIQGNLSLMDTAAPAQRSSSPMDGEALAQTVDATKRAAALTRQLLTFSRKQVFQPLALDINDLAQRQAKLLTRLLGEQINVQTRLGAQLPLVHGDAMSIEQVIINLGINARDAMPHGGQLLISTEVTEISQQQMPPGSAARPGHYVCVTVADSGHGMDEPTLRRIFEPFFTTKDVGKGTGMGLAMVYATLAQHKGWINVRSQVGRGTMFELYLPISHSSVVENEPKTGPLGATTSSGPVEPMRVLLVEDDPSVRRVMQQMLTRSGCSVIESENAEDGYNKWSANRAHIDLIITDLVMPGGQSGEDLARRIFQENPDVNVVYCSGYSPSLFEEGSSLIRPENFLAKPYDAEKVQNVLRHISMKRSGNTAGLLGRPATGVALRA
jgi:two-component system, cell cycle sensor histidine kinase and response regulator CckA